MRFAIGKEGNMVDAYTLKPTQIRQLAPFACPICNEGVILKQGTKRRLHFAHLHTCGRAESVGHHQDKWNVRQLLQSHGYEVDQEVRIGSRRADLVAKRNGKSLIVEVQASPLSVEQYEKRTTDYMRAGLNVIWMASGFEVNQATAFKPWMRLEMNRLHTVMAVSQKTIYRYAGIPVSLKYAHGTWMETSCLEGSPYEAYYHFNHHGWGEIVRRKRSMPPFPSSVNRRLILNRLYPLGIPASLLPSACYLPLTGLWGIHIHPFDFQTVLYINRLENPSDSVEWSIEKTCRQFGIVPTSDFYPRFHVQWKQLLNVCHLSENVCDWPIPQSPEEARRHDKRMFQGLQRLIAKSYKL